jgi:hypothetical protein
MVLTVPDMIRDDVDALSRRDRSGQHLIREATIDARP